MKSTWQQTESHNCKKVFPPMDKTRGSIKERVKSQLLFLNLGVHSAEQINLGVYKEKLLRRNSFSNLALVVTAEDSREHRGRGEVGT